MLIHVMRSHIMQFRWTYSLRRRNAENITNESTTTAKTMIISRDSRLVEQYCMVGRGCQASSGFSLYLQEQSKRSDDIFLLPSLRVAGELKPCHALQTLREYNYRLGCSCLCRCFRRMASML